MTPEVIEAERKLFEAKAAEIVGSVHRQGDGYTGFTQIAWVWWLERAAAPVTVPEGYALVPLKPTMAMSIMGQCAIRANPTVDGGGINLQADCCYRAMIEAASLPPVQETKGK